LIVEDDIFAMSLEELSEKRKIPLILKQFVSLIRQCDKMEEFINRFEDDEVKLYLAELAEVHKPCSEQIKQLRNSIASRIDEILLPQPETRAVQ
jgi:hypothetical protein